MRTRYANTGGYTRTSHVIRVNNACDTAKVHGKIHNTRNGY